MTVNEYAELVNARDAAGVMALASAILDLGLNSVDEEFNVEVALAAQDVLDIFLAAMRMKSTKDAVYMLASTIGFMGIVNLDGDLH